LFNPLTFETAGRYGYARLCAHKLAPVGLLDAFLHASDEAGLIFEHAGNSVFHQLLGVLAIGGRPLLEPLAYSLATKFGYRVLDGAKKVLEARRDPLPITQELGRFTVQAIQVSGDALVLSVDFSLTVK
jgi:hypothetical protein